MASIEQRNGNWSTYWRQGGRGGKKHRCTFGTEKLAIRAKQIAESHRHDISRAEVEAIIFGAVVEPEPVNSGPSVPTVQQLSEMWLNTRTRISPGQRERYASQLRRVILPAIGHLPADQVGGPDIVAILEALVGNNGRTATAATRTRYFVTMSSMFGFAVREKLIPDNPCERTDFVPDLLEHDDAGDTGDDHVYLSRAEYDLIWQHMTERGRPVIDFLVGTGARWSEASAVAIDAYRPKETRPCVRIHRAWKYDGCGNWYLGATKGRNKRTVTLGAHTVAAIEPLLLNPDGVRRRADAFLLTNRSGEALTYTNFERQYWGPAVVAAMSCDQHPPAGTAATGGPASSGRNWRFRPVSTCDCGGRLKRRPTIHDLRHTHVSWMIAKGQPIAAISRRIGHRTTRVTESTYAGILWEVQEGLADAVDAMFA